MTYFSLFLLLLTSSASDNNSSPFFLILLFLRIISFLVFSLSSSLFSPSSYISFLPPHIFLLLIFSHCSYVFFYLLSYSILSLRLPRHLCFLINFLSRVSSSCLFHGTLPLYFHPLFSNFLSHSLSFIPLTLFLSSSSSFHAALHNHSVPPSVLHIITFAYSVITNIFSPSPLLKAQRPVHYLIIIQARYGKGFSPFNLSSKCMCQP